MQNSSFVGHCSSAPCSYVLVLTLQYYQHNYHLEEEIDITNLIWGKEWFIKCGTPVNWESGACNLNPSVKQKNNCNKTLNEITKNKELVEIELITQAMHQALILEKNKIHIYLT